MRIPSQVPTLFLLSLAACLPPSQTPSLPELNQRWVGKSWAAYREVHGDPDAVTPLAGGGQVATYLRTRTDAGPTSPREVVNVQTGERAILRPGDPGDTARQQWGPTGQSRIQPGTTSQFTYQCYTYVHLDDQGLIVKIEQTGNDCP